jgi:hypothetical protein
MPKQIMLSGPWRYGQSRKTDNERCLHRNDMFGFKSEKEKLEAKLTKLLDEAYKLSHTNRKKSDEKTMEAEEVKKQIEAIEAQ